MAELSFREAIAAGKGAEAAQIVCDMLGEQP